MKHRPPDPAFASPAGTPVIECRHVRKAFGRHQVLDGVSCQVARSRITVIMGPTGTGKSALLRHFVGLLRPDTGSVIVEGRSVPDLSEEELLALHQRTGMLFQNGVLFSWMNLFDNVAFPLRWHTKLSEGELREIVTARLEEVGLAGAEEKMPNELSGGMRKRAGLARAVALEPDILLFDEPDSGLDPLPAALLCELIRAVQRRSGATAVVIGHHIKAVLEIADSIILLHGGRVVEQGPKERFRESSHPVTRRFLQGASTDHWQWTDLPQRTPYR